MSTKKAFIKQVKGTTFVAKSNTNHWVVMDGSPADGGSAAGSSPKELLLFALGGCTGSDVVSILTKKRAPVAGFEMNVTGKARQEYPQVFTDIHVEYIVYGDGVRPEDVERAIELSTTKYCSVSAMVKESANLTHSYRIEPASKLATRRQRTATT